MKTENLQITVDTFVDAIHESRSEDERIPCANSVHSQLPKLRTGNALPSFRNTVCRPKKARKFNDGNTGKSSGKFKPWCVRTARGDNRIKPERTLLPSITFDTAVSNPSDSERDILKSGNQLRLEDSQLMTLSSDSLMRKSFLTGCMSSDHLELPTDSRASMEVHIAKSRRPSQETCGNPGNIQPLPDGIQSVTDEGERDNPKFVNIPRLEVISEAGEDPDDWHAWTQNISSDDIEEHFVGIIKRPSMSIMLPKVKEDTQTVDVGGVEITPGLYLKRRVKLFPEGQLGLSKRMEEISLQSEEQNSRTEGSETPKSFHDTRKSVSNGSYPQRLIPPLYPSENPHMYSKRRWSTNSTHLNVGSHDLLNRDPAPMSVFRLMPFENPPPSPKTTMNSVKSIVKYKSLQESSLAAFKFGTENDETDTETEHVLLPVIGRQPGLPFRVQERIQSKKASFKFKRYWDNMKNYLNTISKLQSEVLLNRSVDVYPRKGL